MQTALVIMARHPVVGEVKTRLARAIGAVAACELYTAFLRDLDARFAPGPRALAWAFSPAGRDFAALVRPGARCFPQAGADLGARMHGAFARLCGEGFAPVVMIGADVPHVRSEWLDEAEAALARVDVVLGPSADGGYYLIAMRAPYDVFSGVTMGGPEVLAQTERAAVAAGLRVHRCPASFDVDEPADLERLRDLVRDPAWAARLPHTTGALHRLAFE